MPYIQYIRQIFIPGKILRTIFLACIPALLFYGFSILILLSSGFELIVIIRDTAQLTRLSSFVGFLSNIGIWLWISSFAICFFSAINYKAISRDRHKELLFFVGSLSMILAIDDFFMMHERYINQNLCFALYAFFAVALLVRYYKNILDIDGFSFLLAGLLLALSILIDLSQDYIPLKYEYLQVFEEGCKFVGAATWLYFSARIASFHPLHSTEE